MLCITLAWTCTCIDAWYLSLTYQTEASYTHTPNTNDLCEIYRECMESIYILGFLETSLHGRLFSMFSSKCSHSHNLTWRTRVWKVFYSLREENDDLQKKKYRIISFVFFFETKLHFYTTSIWKKGKNSPKLFNLIFCWPIFCEKWTICRIKCAKIDYSSET